MSTGVLALLDDVVALTKIAASSLDDVSAQVAKAGSKAVSKAAGIVIDDAAVTPRYVVGFAAERELPIIRKIALGSLRNKLLVLLPSAVLLSWGAPWLIVPLLMLGGAFLCLEGWGKVSELVFEPSAGDVTPPDATHDAGQLEQIRIAGAIRTDFILSAEIMAITLSTTTSLPLWLQGLVLAVVGIGITAAVYGAVAILVKMDDLGVYLAQRTNPVTRQIGRTIVVGMPYGLQALSVVGTLAMLWVGGGIIVHGLHELGIHTPDRWIAGAGRVLTDVAGPIAGWGAEAALAGIVGLTVGGAVALLGRIFTTPAKAGLEPGR